MKKTAPKYYSYSKYSTFANCPLKYRFKYKDKLPDPSGPAADRGTMIHKKAENVVNGKIKGMPKELIKFKDEIRNLKRLYKNELVSLEADISVDHNWQPCKYNDWDKVYVIGYADVKVEDGLIETDIIDYKTGKFYPGHFDQGHLYGTLELSRLKVDTVNIEMYYLDSGNTFSDNSPKSMTFYRKDLARMQSIWDARFDKIAKEKRFIKTPNPLCGWCNFHVKKGGKCTGK